MAHFLLKKTMTVVKQLNIVSEIYSFREPGLLAICFRSPAAYSSNGAFLMNATYGPIKKDVKLLNNT